MLSLQRKINADSAEVKGEEAPKGGLQRKINADSAEVKGEEAPKGGLQRKVSADIPKNKRQRSVIPKGIRVVVMVSYVSSNIHLHDTLHHTFAFINIHLDIHKIIIIITYKLASALKEKASGKKGKEVILCFVVYAKKGRCFSPSAQKN
jgi:hypothetical protein